MTEIHPIPRDARLSGVFLCASGTLFYFMAKTGSPAGRKTKKYNSPFITKEMELRSQIISLVKREIGFGVELFGLLSIDEMKDGRFRVLDQRDETLDICEGEETLFKSIKAAVDYFLKIREERKLGYDFDEEGNPDDL